MKKKIIFSYQPPIANELDVFLAGDFNHWNSSSHRLKDRGGVYETALELAPGEYKYHFIINGKVSLDPAADTITSGNLVYSFLKVVTNEEYLYLVNFRIKDLFNYEEVSIVGDFNKWKPNYNRLYKEGDVFSTTLFLNNGSYQYKYLAKDSRWFNEKEIKAKTKKIASDSSCENSFIDPTIKSKVIVNRELIATFDTNQIELKQNVVRIFRYSEDLFEFKAIIPDSLGLQVKLSLQDDLYDLDFVASDSLNSAFNRIIKITDLDLIYSYKLVIRLGDLKIYGNKRSLTNNPALASVFVPSEYKIFSLSSDLSQRVMYQIMPDRFCNGDSSLNQDFQEDYYAHSRKKPKKGTLTRNQEYYHLAKWDETDILTLNPYSEAKEPDWFAFYGGDFSGVKAKIPYLKELGVNLIYFNPIFQAKSPHRYDTIDFKQIDPHLGTNESFQALVQELHSHDIKVIIDIALNHCGVDFMAFADTVKKGKESLYWSWFDWKKWPLPKKIDKNFNAEEYYQCWWGIKDLPDFNFDLLRESPAENKITDINQAQPNVGVVNYLLESLKYWVETVKIDGFRLDVPEEVPFWFWQIFRTMLKKLNPDIYLVGEIWNNPQDWLQGQYFDAVMNYQSFKDPVIAYFIQDKISLKSFINTISAGLLNNSEAVIKSQMNLLSSHDTVRIRRLGNDNLNKLRLALLFQFTFIGIPHIYYGDEVFLDGNKDPDNRRPFPWDYAQDKIRVQVLEFYKTLITIRKNYHQFTDGKIKFIKHHNLLIYERFLNDSQAKVLVIINNTNTKVEIGKFINSYPQEIISKKSTNVIAEYGYYIGSK